jgi:Ni/Fe-hydrogenase subunit HybB-like protein
MPAKNVLKAVSRSASPGVLGNVIAAAYFPSWVEVAVSIGIVGYGLLAFTLGIRYLPLFPEEVPESMVEGQLVNIQPLEPDQGKTGAKQPTATLQ